jgi:hypothetical protein
VDTSALVYAPGVDGGFLTIGELMSRANEELGLHPITVVTGPDRAYQENLKNALEQANMNLNFVLPPPAACGATN